MKRKIIALLMCSILTVSLCACDANDVNSVIDKAADKLKDVEVKQEDLDKLEDALSGIKDAVGEMVEDPDMQDALKSGAEAVIDIVGQED